MRENEFERKVQQQMEELQLSPSASVWPRVEKELRQKKRRRIVFFIALLAGLGLLGYSGYILLNPGSTPVAVRRDSVFSPRPVNNDDRITPAKKELVKQDRPGSVVEQSPAGTGTTANQKAEYTEAGKKNWMSKKKQETTGNEMIYTYTAPATGQKNDPVTTQTIYQPEQQVPEEPGTPTVMPADKKDSTHTAIAENRLPEENDPVIAENKPLLRDSASETGGKENTEPVIVKKKEAISKIRFGLDLSAGMAFNRDNVFSLTNPAMNDSYNYNPVASGGGPVGPVIRPPSPIKAGPSFKAGVVAEWKISPRSSLSAGLRYTYLAEKIKVGVFRDTSILSNSYLSSSQRITGVYRSVPEQTYTNRYHFIEVPLLYQLRLNKSNKMAVQWNAGLSVNYMVATNALVYDTAAGGTYYRNKNALNRLQANVHTGFSFRFGNPAGMQWSVGPEVSLGMTRLTKQEPFIKKRYLLYGGVTARLIFPQRKR